MGVVGGLLYGLQVLKYCRFVVENVGLGMPVGVSIVSGGVKGKLLFFFLSAVSATGLCAAPVCDCVVSVIAACFSSDKIGT